MRHLLRMEEIKWKSFGALNLLKVRSSGLGNSPIDE
jgi:hypothetical protein